MVTRMIIAVWARSSSSNPGLDISTVSNDFPALATHMKPVKRLDKRDNRLGRRELGSVDKDGGGDGSGVKGEKGEVGEESGGVRRKVRADRAEGGAGEETGVRGNGEDLEGAGDGLGRRGWGV